MKQIYKISKVKEKLRTVNPNIEILSDTYFGNNVPVLCKCLVDDCGHEWYARSKNLLYGKGCPKCATKNRGKLKRIKLNEATNIVKNINQNVKLIEDLGMVDGYHKYRAKCMEEDCGYIWDANWSNLSVGCGCPKCAKTIKPTIQDIIKELKINNDKIEILSDEYTDNKTKLLFRCAVDGYEWWSSLNNLRRNWVCPKCNGSIDLTIDIIKDRLSKISPNINILSNEYISANTKLDCRCNIDGYEWSATWGHLSQGRNCPMCSNKIVSVKNSIRSIRPDLVKYLENELDADNISAYSTKKVLLICLSCGNKREMTTSKFCSRGFNCNICSDGISIPEKFGIYLFKQLKIDFSRQKRFEWSDGRFYDFYFELNNKSYIIEAHGEQHYKQSNRGRSLEEEKLNDKYKKQLALMNGIDVYVEIDCRKSEFEWLKYNYIKSLNNHINMLDVSWDLIWVFCHNSIVISVCNEWSNGTSIKSLEKMFELSNDTIKRYLKTGNDIGIIKYDKTEEYLKLRKSNSKIVYQYSLNLELIDSFEGVTQAKKKIGISGSGIYECANGKRKTAGGFIWSYVKL